MWVILGYAEAAAHMRDSRCLRQAHLDTLVERFGNDRIFARQKLDIPYMDGEPHASVRKADRFRGFERLMVRFH